MVEQTLEPKEGVNQTDAPGGRTEETDLEILALRLAETHTIQDPADRRNVRNLGNQASLPDFIDDYKVVLKDAHGHFQAAAEREIVLSYAAEWILDNYYVVVKALQEINRDLPKKYYRQLPKLNQGPLKGYPRVFALAREIIVQDNCLLDVERVESFVSAYQTVNYLTMGELWALPIMLRFGIIQSLVLALVRVTRVRNPEDLPSLALIQFSSEISSDEIVANCIVSLRTLDAENWKKFFEDLSVVERMLRQDPAGIYTGMDFETRDRYRKAVEDLARDARLGELEVAREAVLLARARLEPDKPGSKPRTEHPDDSRGPHPATMKSTGWDGFQSQRNEHVGYYLLDQGRAELENRFTYQPSLVKRFRRGLFAHPTLVYLGSITLLTLLIILLLLAYASSQGSEWWQLVLTGLLGLIPALTISTGLVNWVITNSVEPRVLPKMDFHEGVPAECATLVAIPTLLTGSEEVDSLLQQIELHYLRNPDARLSFALVSDFADADSQNMPGDEELVQRASTGIARLNEKYGREKAGPFFLLHRKRQWNPKDARWMGWERKRGKLQELNSLILYNQPGSFSVLLGNLERLQKVRYLISLDADTILPLDSAKRLVATLAHPLNRAEFAPGRGRPARDRVVAGYTVLQPRTEIKPTSSNLSWFTRIYSGDTGLDLYTLAVSDVYQDLFKDGIYVGKGILDIAAFERSLAGFVPENALLSHDLFEGIHGRVALVTDIILLEDFPPHYLVHINRLHRWVRGDWQLLPWLFPRVPSASGRWLPNHLSLIDRWKILDNLRRSMVPPILLALFVFGWLWLPGSPLLWTLLGLVTLGVPMLTNIINGLLRWLSWESGQLVNTSIWKDFARWILALAFLPYEAQLNLHAILITLYRVFFTRRHLLQWTTAAQTVQKFGQNVRPLVTVRQMIGAPFWGLFMALLIGVFRPEVMATAAPLLLLWVLSPQVAYLVSRPIQPKVETITSEQRQELRNLARRTWLFFEQFLGPEDHWLAPDHYQEHPLGVVAHRTSPTNIGMALLSTLGAYDMGYIGPLDLGTRLRTTFETLENLERYRGHFLNWYDTHSLEVLPPRYVSTVDSGNLAASLITLGHGCLSVVDKPVLRWEIWEGFLDTLTLLTELLQEMAEKGLKTQAIALIEHLEQVQRQILAVRERPDTWAGLLSQLAGEDHGTWSQIDPLFLELIEAGGPVLSPDDLQRLRTYNASIRQEFSSTLREVRILLPWLFLLESASGFFMQADIDPAVLADWEALRAALPSIPTLAEIDPLSKTALKILEDLQDHLVKMGWPEQRIKAALGLCSELSEALRSASMAARVLHIGFQELYWQANAYVEEMDFNFLFDSQRQVFHIGYNLAAGRLDNNYYDLLASEARIASLVAIAMGDIPQSHWLHLARPLTQVDGLQSLLSWSATMFEYLMPDLFTNALPGTLLHQSSNAAVNWQIAYGRQKGVPWGISESGYYRFDANLFYQYRAFGIPGLGYKRGLGDDLVIAPYASLLAVPLRPQSVLENIEDLYKLRMLGIYGFYEAVDFTASRLPIGSPYAIVRSFMSHHQGMILLSLVNYLKDGRMVQRFHAHPKIQSVELLLQEQIPQNAPLEQPEAEDGRTRQPVQAQVSATPWLVRVQTPQPRVQYLSNGRYGVLISSSGSGYSSWKEVDLTRWRPDTTLNNYGTWIYVKDRDSGKFWSAGYHPTAVSPENRDIFFNAYMVEFRRRDQDISTAMEITIPPEDDVEIRRINLTNHSGRPRRLSLASYAEIILAPQAADMRHPAFNKLFIESEWLPEVNALVFRRRPRSSEEKPVYLAHFVVRENGPVGSDKGVSYETDRMHFLGRGRQPRSPAALTSSKNEIKLIPAAGSTLDPVYSISQEIELEPNGSAHLAFITVAAGSHQEIMALIDRYKNWHLVERAFDQARSQAEVELRQLNLTTQRLERYQLLLSLMFYPTPALRADPAVLAANRKGQPGLWAYGISGDYPILLVQVNSSDHLPLVQELLQAHLYWRKRKLMIDLVILNTQSSGYSADLMNNIHRLLARMDSDAWLNRRGGIFLLVADQMGEMDRVLLETAARAILYGDEGSLAEQLDQSEGLERFPARLPPFAPSVLETDREKQSPTPPLLRPEGLRFDNGLGGFSPDGREYRIYLRPGEWTPAPWVNVVANPEFGFLVSESGSSYTWSLNSGENRLTPWNNDAISDPPGEVVYIRDEETAKIWSPTPLPVSAPEPYLIRHGAGYSIFEHHSHGLKQRLRMFIAPDEPVKIVQLRLENTRERGRRITVTFYAEWVLGVNRDTSQPYVIPEFDAESQALLARNPYNPEFGERVAFAAGSKLLHGLTTDRTEFLGRMGSVARPAALERIGLSGTVQAGLDPCAALQIHVDLPPGGVEEVYFLIGQAAERETAVQLVQKYKNPEQVASAWNAETRFWDDFLETVQVKTPDPAMDLLLNRWLLYQALSCRIWGRSAFYQSSGAYGFRDQLQDVMALLYAAPKLTREHLLRAAAHQFEAGDVLHWWHPPSGRGVRTRISDDLLWLPYVTAEYISATGDVQVLQEKISFKRAPLLGPEEEERYGLFPDTQETYTLYEHCQRSIERGTTAGRHNLPLIGTGDWNDGMNRVGNEGRGESVWLGWFLYDTLQRFAQVSDLSEDEERATWYRQRAAELQQAIDLHGWDGEWYLRAYYDDGTPLGSAQNRECRIDSLAQSWAVLTGAGDPQKVEQAMGSLSRLLVRQDDHLLMLFTPPFDQTPRDPGYIKGYLPGVRENGGQYTHAALWAIWAFARMGYGDDAFELFQMINPVCHSDSPEKVARYMVEPYVVAADVYSVHPRNGRGGWTWYTGSSGWMYRLGVEAILGIRKEAGDLVINPCIPKEWPGFEVTYRLGMTVYQISVDNQAGVNRGVTQTTLDGQPLLDGRIPLVDDGQTHRVEIRLG